MGANVKASIVDGGLPLLRLRAFQPATPPGGEVGTGGTVPWMGMIDDAAGTEPTVTSPDPAETASSDAVVVVNSVNTSCAETVMSTVLAGSLGPVGPGVGRAKVTLMKLPLVPECVAVIVKPAGVGRGVPGLRSP
jgi:hypothetical protein